MDEIELTPGEELVMEVLAARWRLGENLWTFSTSQKRWLVSLEEKGLVNAKSGIVEKTMRAWLTDAGKTYYWKDEIPACGETDSKNEKVAKSAKPELPKKLVKLVPKSWTQSKKKKQRRIARYVHFPTA